jgi:Leucine-rich repeat (LRR) protein
MMSHLRILDLRNNNLTQLPLSLEDLQSLEQLYLDSNRLSSLPHSVGSLQRLLILSVRKNNLAQLPGSLPLLVNLQQLFVTDNAIKEIPLMLGSLRGLKKLDLSGNPCMSKVPGSVTDTLEYIREQYKSSDAKKNLRMKLAVRACSLVSSVSSETDSVLFLF